MSQKIIAKSFFQKGISKRPCIKMPQSAIRGYEKEVWHKIMINKNAIKPIIPAFNQIPRKIL